ncbi:scabin-related ADP-ribosyltransferase [Nonomuraea sp. 10N515B]
MVPEGVRSLKDALRQAESSLDSIGEELWNLLSRAWLLPTSADTIRRVAAWAGTQGPEINKRLVLLERMELEKPELFGAGKPPISVDDSYFAPGAVLPTTGGFWDRVGQQIQATFDPNLNSGDGLTEAAKGAVESVAGLGKMVIDFSPNRAIVDFWGWQRSMSDLAQSFIYGVQNPTEFFKSALDWDTWTSNPERAFGRLIPDIVAAITTGGSSGAVSGATKAMGALGKAAKNVINPKPRAGLSPYGQRFELKGKEVPPLFRGDGRTLNRIFENGMTARNPDMSIEDHLSGENGLIAASKSKMVSRGFAIRNKGYIFEIDDRGNGMEVKYGPGFKHLIGEQEVVFKRIEPSQIRGAWKPGKYGSADDVWIPNPNYVPR